MPFLANFKYSRISMAQQQICKTSSEEDSLDSGERLDSSLLERHDFENFRPRSGLIPHMTTIITFTVAITSIVMFVMGLQWELNADRKCLKIHSAYSPALREVSPTYGPVEFNGTLDYPSIYRGDPSPQIDAAWNILEDVRVMRISEEEVLKIGKTTDAIRIPDQFGGGYMAGIEVIHQLHCLNFLRKSLFPTYYAPPSPYASAEFSDDPSMLATHQSHCIEMLRQFVMCHADMGIITFRWVKDHPRPYPDFNTLHQCRNFDEALQWTKEKQLKEQDGGPPEGWTYVPQEGEVVLDVPP